MMVAAQNKQLVQRVFAEMAKGSGTAFLDAMADDVCWTITGTTPWSRTYDGKQAVIEELLRPLRAQLSRLNRIKAHRFVAEGDIVVVEATGDVTTKDGKPYNNSYCWVIRLADGRIRELTEYMDTALAEAVLEGPG